MTKLNDLLKSKPAGSEWFTIQAPEELRVWTTKNPWKDEFEKEYNVKLDSVEVSTVIDIGKGIRNRESFSKKTPLIVCGRKIVNGFISTTMTKKARFTVIADSIREFSAIMQKLSAIVEASSWSVSKIKIFSDGKVVEFRKHDPDGNGIDLFLYSVGTGKERMLYPNIPYNVQQNLCKGFIERFAHCTASVEKIPVHGCSLKKRIHKEQLKELRKKSIHVARRAYGLK